MSWLFYSVITVFFYTAWSLVARIATVKSNNPRAFSLIYNIFAALSGILLFAFPREDTLPITLPVIFITLGALFFWGIYGRVEFYSTKYVEASTLSVVSKVGPMITFILSTILFSEPVTLLKILALLFIIGGNIIALYENKKITIKSGLGYALITAAAAGTGWVFDKYLVSYYPQALYVTFSYAITAAIVSFFPALKLSDIQNELKKGSWKIALISVCGAVGYFFQLKAMAVGEASRVILIISSTSVFTILLGIILLKENTYVWRKIIAGILVFIGIVLLG